MGVAAQVIRAVATVLDTLLNIGSILILARALLSWFISPYSRLMQVVVRLSEPIILPFRPLARRLTNGRLPIDLAPFFTILAISILQRIVAMAAAGLLRLVW
ncbi:MAG: YggT family protein [Christensenellaceae bacterium]|nr:YggT family protein [Christensenellaceae bacterium]